MPKDLSDKVNERLQSGVGGRFYIRKRVTSVTPPLDLMRADVPQLGVLFMTPNFGKHKK